MKRLFILLFILVVPAAVFAQGYNSKEGSHRGYNPPTTSQTSSWSGSGIAIGTKLFATNNHVVDGATNLYVYFPETKKRYRAETVTVDATNDLAIVRVTDAEFSGFPSIKYGFKKAVEDVGVSIYVLGYPMVETMGAEVKLTTGVVSSRSGYQGNQSQYQISAPVQPGNSGGPLFNDKGELIGIISAKHTGADNVSYGIKLSYLVDLANKAGISTDLGRSSQISSLVLSEQCKSVIPCTVMVLANNERSQSQEAAPTVPSTNSPKASRPSSHSYPIHCSRPNIARRGTNNVDIYAVEVTEEFTALYMKYTCTQSNGAYYVEKDTYIVDKSTGKRYTLTRTKNCAIGPNYSRIEYGATVDFVLYFPSLPADVSEIDFIEPNTSSTWKFYGIQIE